jgi:D-beta-D-heptose 7-phosphate kinase/D-beta-D-heptose 1-phosphate adenosyltransferase
MRAALPPGRARHLVSRFPDLRLAVVGDAMIDQFVVGRVTRISPEAPVPVVAFEREDSRLGGAANVAHNIRALGGAVSLVALAGRDAAGDTLERLLGDAGIGHDTLARVAGRPTTRKARLVTTRNQQVARIDYEDDREAADEEQRELTGRATRAIEGADLVVVSDYQKGVVTRAVMAHVVRAAAERRVPVVVDPKIPHVAHYRGATLVTPNHHEAERATGLRIRTEQDATLAARRFRDIAACTSVLITWGEHGMWLLDGPRLDQGAADAEFGVPATAREVADVTGAGDTVVATLGLSLAAGATLAEAAMLANYAAGISVSKFGPATVTADELLAAVVADPPA